MFTKISLLALYVQVFRPSCVARAFIWLGIIAISVIYIAVTVAMLAYMLPRPGDGGWGSLANTQRVGIPSRVIDLTQGFFSAFSDFYVLIIPIVVVSGLQLPLTKKIGLTGVFLTGLISCGCSITGIVFRYDALYFDVEDNRWLSIKFEALWPIFRKAESVFVHLKGRLCLRPNKERAATEVKATSPPEISPQVPSGTLSGLKSFFRRVGHTQRRVTEKSAPDTLMSEDLELQSIDYDYHAQMRQSA
ncbi:hypothetical protein PG996_004962 [Apiospora saccharicola]|uniref:Rhodopsin domain-containing protein n=1 Tax=Apiospora saccharicola TaxID=335842 RepID=A0ABR1VP02_9PEZI